MLYMDCVSMTYPTGSLSDVLSETHSGYEIDICALNAGKDDEISVYLLKSPHTLLYASPDFMALVSGHLSAFAGWVVAKDDKGEIRGVLPYAVKQGAAGPVYNSFAYYGSNGGVIQAVKDDGAKAAIISAFYKLAEENKALSATIITNPILKDHDFYESATGFDFRDERISMVTHFPEGETPDNLIKQFDDPRPRNIRRAEKEGVMVEASHSVEAMDFLYHTHQANMLAIGGQPKDHSFFDAIPETMEEGAWDIYIAKLDGKPVAALLIFYFNQTVEYFTPVIVEEYRNTQALALTIYRAMQDSMRRGFRNWNWGGTWLTQGGVYDFKKRWGTTEYRYFYYTRLFDKSVLSRPKDFFVDNYEGFFVIPFSALQTNDKGQA